MDGTKRCCLKVIRRKMDNYRRNGRAVVHKHNRRSRTTQPPMDPSISCGLPSRSLTVDHTGYCFACSCPQWVPYVVENILNFKSFEEVFADPVMIKIQESTRPGGSFKFCNTLVCGVANPSQYEFYFSNKIPMDSPYRAVKPIGPAIPLGYVDVDDVEFLNCYQINIAIDDSCNLQCATCRTSMIHHHNKGPVYDYKKKLINHICNLLDSFDHPTLITIGGDGEIFSSQVYSDMIYNYKPNPKHRFVLKTNGTLVSSKIKESQIMKQIQRFSISVDAGSKEVYEKVRWPGKWSAVTSSLDLLTESYGKIDSRGRILSPFNLNFVLHRENMYDLVNFLELCQKYNAPGTVQAIQNWGTYSDGIGHPEFFNQRVHKKDDLNYHLWQEVAKQVMDHPGYNRVRLEHEILSEL